MTESFLPDLYKDLKGDFVSKVNGCNVTLSMDGWKNIKNDPTLGYGVAANGKSWLLDLKVNHSEKVLP